MVPDARLVSSDLRSSPSGAVSVKVRCPLDESRCAGTVTLRTVGAVAASNARVGRTRATVLTLARHAFAVDGGRVTTVVLHLSSAARNLLARARVMNVRATVFAEDDAGNVHTQQTIVTLHAPAANRRS
jgi:hypothetical protein